MGRTIWCRSHCFRFGLESVSVAPVGTYARARWGAFLCFFPPPYPFQYMIWSSHYHRERHGQTRFWAYWFSSLCLYFLGPSEGSSPSHLSIVNPNLAVNTDAPSAALRAGRWSPVTLVR